MNPKKQNREACSQSEGGAEQGSVVNGVAIGIVTHNENGEGEMARVKVRFPWCENLNEGYWARLAIPLMAHNRGTYFVPDVGDEVIVAFLHGDLSYPVVLGCLWNDQDVPPGREDKH